MGLGRARRRRGCKVSVRTAKRWCKDAMRAWRLEHVRTVGTLFIVKPRLNFRCLRWYSFVVCAEDHPKLPLLIREQRDGLTPLGWEVEIRF